jgi:hypothetical protein
MTDEERAITLRTLTGLIFEIEDAIRKHPNNEVIRKNGNRRIIEIKNIQFLLTTPKQKE